MDKPLLIALLGIGLAGVMAPLNEARSNSTLATRAADGQDAARTRADVRAEVAAAMARGERLSQGDTNRNSPSVQKPRADARTEAMPRDAVGQ